MSDRAFRLFGEYYRKRRHKYESLRNDLIRANIFIPPERWMSLALFTSILVLIILIIVFFVAKIILSLKIDWISLSGDIYKKFAYYSSNIPYYIKNLPYIIFYLPENFPEYVRIIDEKIPPASETLPNLYQIISIGVSLTIWEILIAVSLIAIIPLLTYNIFRIYPKLRAWERGRRIDGVLPHAIGYISSMAAVGVIPYEIFKKLSKAEDMYGEVSIEAKKIVRDVELLGYDFLSALRNLAVTTPSNGLRVFLQGAVTTALSGGEMGEFFVNKARDYLEENRKKYEDFITTLAMITEVYIVGLVAAPLFIIVLYTAMLMLKGAEPSILFFVVYGIIPIGSILFIILVDAITPEGAK